MRPFDENGLFRSSEQNGGLRQAAVRGSAVMVFSQVFSFAVSMIGTVVLARLLMPADFGVVTMVTTFSLLAVSAGQIGFPEAVLQREQIDHTLASNLFWINLGVSSLLTIAFAAAGSLLARFYHDPRVARVAMAMSLTIVLTSVSVLHLGLLKRAMCFTAVSATSIAAGATSVIVSVSLAWARWGYWALVAGAVTLPLAQSIGVWSVCRWVPSLPRRANGTGSAMAFATHVYGRFSVDYFARNLDNLLVGWRFGSASLGFYKKAFDLFSLPANQIFSAYSVAVATLSRLNGDRVKYQRYFLGGLSALAIVGMAVGADLTLVSKDLVLLVLGPRWEPSGQIFMFFGPGIGMMLIYLTHGVIHLSIGTPSRWFRWGIIEFVVTGALFLLALPWGATGIAAAWTASFYILTVPALWYAGRPVQLSVKPMVGAVWRFAVASLLAGLACAAIVRQLPSLAAAEGAMGAFIRIVSTSVVFVVLYVGAIILLHGGFAPIVEFSGILKEMAPWKKASRATAVPCEASTG